MKALDPTDPIETFVIGPWQVTIRQRVTGALYWVAARSTPRRVRQSDPFPVGFTVRDVRADAEHSLRDLAD
ncbi:MAG TPA: hypothetical protein VH539_07050 [Gemmatimonadaceae bacterium]|jgi:hypothetical protein